MSNLHYITAELSKNLSRFEDLLKNCTAKEYLWKPTENAWCLLEVLCHLYDEERYDFKARIQHLFEHPGTHPPTFDTKKWVIDHQYLQQNYHDAWNRFETERRKSIAWLEQQQESPWEHHFEHTYFGTMTASLFLTNWLAHDYFHLRQILKIKALYLAQETAHSLAYAGGI